MSRNVSLGPLDSKPASQSVAQLFTVKCKTEKRKLHCRVVCGKIEGLLTINCTNKCYVLTARHNHDESSVQFLFMLYLQHHRVKTFIGQRK